MDSSCIFYLEIFPMLIWTRFLLDFRLSLTKFSNTLGRRFNTFAKKCPTLENVTDFRYSKQKNLNVSETFIYVLPTSNGTPVLFRALCTRTESDMAQGTVGDIGVCVCVWLVYACTECFTLLKLGAAEVWSPVVLHVIISFQIALVLQTYTSLT